MAAASLALGVRFTAGAAGSSAFTDAGAVAGYRGTSALTVGKTYRYRAENAALTEWEWGTGVWNGTNLTRVLSFSSTGGVVSFAAAPQVAITIEPGDVLSFTDAMSLTDVEKAQGRANIGVPGRNLVHNGQFAINQRGAAGGVTDNSNTADRWRVIGEFSSANIFADNYNAAGGNVPSAALQFVGTTDKGGLFQVVEGRNCKHLRGKTVTLSMLMLVSNTRLGNMKIGILEWTGTEDATTGDPVATWGADGVTPTLATNWAFKNTPANLGVTTSSVQYYTTVTLGSTFTNLAVMIWNDDKSYTVGDNFSVTNVQLEEGGAATLYAQRPYTQEYALCLYYFWRIAQGVTSASLGMGFFVSATVFRSYIQYPLPMRIAPSVTFSAPSTFEVVGAGGAPTAISAVIVGKSTIDLATTVPTSTVGVGGWIRDAAGAASISISADL